MQSSSGDNRLKGRWGEALAAAYLQKKHYRVVATNFSCRFGEVDLIVRNRQYLVFVEVKLRRSASYVQAREYVTPAKQQRLRTTAMYWLSCHETDLQPRFDIIEIYAPDGVNTINPEIRHLENAFS